MSLQCKRGNCHALPVPSCFGEANGWRYTANNRQDLLRHRKLHEKFGEAMDVCLEVASRCSKTEDGQIQCRCGKVLTIGKVLQHTCAKTTQVSHVMRKARRKNSQAPAGRKSKKRRRCVETFASALPLPTIDNAAETDLVQHHASAQEQIAHQTQTVQKKIGRPFLRLLSPASRAGSAPNVLRRHTKLQEQYSGMHTDSQMCHGNLCSSK